MTFFVLLALFPGIAGLVALYGLYADAHSITQHLAAVTGILPEGGVQIIRDQVERLTAQPTQRLGFATMIGLGISLWSANAGMKAMFDALNVVYHEEEKRRVLPAQRDLSHVHIGSDAFCAAGVGKYDGFAGTFESTRAFPRDRTLG